MYCLQLGDVGVAVERVHAAGGVPGRARGELGALDQHDVGPAGLGEMIEHAAADDAAADDGDLDMRLSCAPHPTLSPQSRREGVKCRAQGHRDVAAGSLSPFRTGRGRGEGQVHSVCKSRDQNFA